MSEWDAISKPATASEWDAVSRVERRKPPPVNLPPLDVDPSAGMGGWEKFAVGMGQGADKAIRGVKGLFGADTTEGDEDAKLYAKYRPEGWQTTAGEIAGSAAAQAPLALIPGALPAQIAIQAAGSAAMEPGGLKERATAGALGAGGAGAGHLLTRTLGRVAKPIGDKADDIKALEALGVEPTFGQGMAAKGGAIGRSVGRMEESAQSVPFASGPLRRTRERAMDQWRQATRDAASPPGVSGAATVDDVGKAFNDAYTDALDTVPLPYASVQYQPDLRVLSQGRPITQAQRDLVEQTFSEIRLKNMQNPTPGVQVSAAGAHSTESELKALGRQYGRSQDPSQQDLGALFTRIAHDYGDTWRSALPADTARTVAALDKVYPSNLAIRDAARKVGMAASEGVPDAYTPAVLQRSAKAVDTGGKNRYIRGEAPMQEMARLGQKLQGKVPDSGTPERAMAAGVLGGAAGVAGLGVPLAALGAYGTKGAQNYMMGRSFPSQQEFMMQLLRRSGNIPGVMGAAAANELND